MSGLSTSAYSLGALALPRFDAPPVFGDFAWTIALAIAVAVVVQVVLALGRLSERVATPRPFVVLPLVGLVVAVLAYVFGQATDESATVRAALRPGRAARAWSRRRNVVGRDARPAHPLLRGWATAVDGQLPRGPDVPALFLGAAAGVMASHLPGLSVTPAVAVCMAAATVSVLRLPLSAVVLAIVLTGQAGPGAGPLIIVAVAVAMVITLVLTRQRDAQPNPANAQPQDTAAPPTG